MGTFKDIIDTLAGLEGDVVDFIVGGNKHRSLSKSSLEGTFNFPVIVPDDLTIEDATLVSKALERQFASFTLTVLTMNPYLSTYGTTPSAQKYLKKYHQNLDVRTDMTDILNVVPRMMTEAAEKLGVEYDTLTECEQHIMFKIYEGVNCMAVNKENLRFNYTIDEVTESGIVNDIFNTRPRILTEASDDEEINVNVDTGDINIDMSDIGHDIGSSLGRALNRGQQSRASVDRKQLNHQLDNDYKKANELVPTLLHMRIYPYDKSTSTPLDAIDFIVGIKATLHPVTSEEMILNMARGIKNDSKFFNMIRWTTGEIRFMRDFVLGVSELKLDAKNTGSTTSRWWTMLKRRRGMARIKNVVMPNKMLPNATIVMTRDGVDALKKQYGYDLNNVNLVYRLMEQYFLIAFVIVDPGLQRVQFLFDGKNEYDVQTFAGLARENQVDDKKFKEMMNMLGRRM